MCKLTAPKQGELENLIGKKMEPGQLFTELKLRGINLCPSNEDASSCFQEGSPSESIVIKEQHLETQALNDIQCSLELLPSLAVFGTRSGVAESVFFAFWRKLIRLMTVAAIYRHADLKMARAKIKQRKTGKRYCMSWTNKRVN